MLFSGPTPFPFPSLDIFCLWAQEDRGVHLTGPLTQKDRGAYFDGTWNLGRKLCNNNLNELVHYSVGGTPRVQESYTIQSTPVINLTVDNSGVTLAFDNYWRVHLLRWQHDVVDRLKPSRLYQTSRAQVHVDHNILLLGTMLFTVYL